MKAETSKIQEKESKNKSTIIKYNKEEQETPNETQNIVIHYIYLTFLNKALFFLKLLESWVKQNRNCFGQKN